MSNRITSLAFACLLSALYSINIFGQSFGAKSSAISLSDCNEKSFYNITGSGADLIGPADHVLPGANLGAYTQNSGGLVLRGAEVRTFKNSGASNICNVKMYYRSYPESGSPGIFNIMEIPFLDDCDMPAGTYATGGTCAKDDKKWRIDIADGVTIPYSPADLTTKPAGKYILEIYFVITGSLTSTSACDRTVLVNNNGDNYKASYFIQSPVLNSTNPTTCNGNEGSIIIGGLSAGDTYSISYMDDGAMVGPSDHVANGAGQVILSGLNAGIYSDFSLLINGCNTDLNTGLILSNPLFTPTFNKIASFCAGSVAPTLQSTSNNGVTGTWSPAVIDNQNSGTYRFTPDPGQCGIPVNINVVVNPLLTPTFSFGTALTICEDASAPVLPTTSANGKMGTWSPSVIDNQNSGTYTFTPANGQCATTTSLSVTVNPNITPTFTFGTALSICAGETTPALPTTSSNNITGIWSPSTIDNQNSGTYTFTPTTGLCATPTMLTVTVNPRIIPTFDFGTAISICSGDDAIPNLKPNSTNGISGTWSPSEVSNTSSGVYTFTPSPGLCASPITFTVTVNNNTVPTFDFGTSLTICSGENVPVLPALSANNITGTWFPGEISNTESGTYTFLPAEGFCATTATISVTVNPNITPTFSFGTTLSICADATVPVLPSTSSNSIAGTWSPSTIDNQNSGTYIFTPTGGSCATTTSLTVTVNPNVIPAFEFGTSLTICADGTVPGLPTTSANGITGTWSPAAVSNSTSATYIFTPTAGLCATTVTFTVTVAANITPTFAFGTSLTICADGTVPTLPATSLNGITGTWSTATVDNQNSGTYTFTPGAGQCATNATFTVTVNPNITPTFSFGTSQTICAGATTPVLPATSENNIAGTWSPSTIDNQNSGIYTFTPAAGLCATTTTLTVTVSPNLAPTFNFGTLLAICNDGMVPVLPTTSENGITGSWSPAVVSNSASATYTFTPTAGLCATTATFTVTVAASIIPTFDFGTSLTICANGIVPTLPATSLNGITGTWSTAVVDNQNSGTYTFTPGAGQCAMNATFTVTVNPITTPTFSFGTALSICGDATVPVLPTTSSNSITGTWSPSTIDNQNPGTYTFTPTAGLCATTTTLTVTVNPNVIPTFDFGTAISICAGDDAIPNLKPNSTNGISGTWNPSEVSNTSSGVYTFTPSPGLCASPITFTVTVNNNAVPTFDFGTSLTICSGEAIPVLPLTSVNNITGTWYPSEISNTVSDTYTFLPAEGFCATIATFSVTVNPNITPTFSFGTTQTICENATAPILPATSLNNITGTWNPSVVNNQSSGIYTFTPSAGQCATTAIFTVTVNTNDIPTFSFGSSLTICAGENVPSLPASSENGISGTWNPATVDNQNSGTYTFTPGGGCASPTTLNVTVTPNVKPTFTFGTTLTICAEDFVPALPATSENGITGTWNPTEINKQTSGVYTFTPAGGVCATAATLTVTVNQNVLPTFEFGTTLTVCSDSTVPVLPTTSTNGIIGTWSPATIDKKSSGTYTFTPAAGSCGTMATFTVTVTQSIAPTFDFEKTLSICTGGDVPTLPVTSTNNIDGTWEPAIINKQASGVYTFTPNAMPEQCIGKFTLTVTVNPILEPTFDFGKTLSLCRGTTAPLLAVTSINGITGTWSPAVISNQVSGTYTFTSTPGQCATSETTLVVTVHDIPTINQVSDNTVNDGTTIPAINLSGTPANVIYNWTNSNPAIGLGGSGTGNIPSFMATNQGNTPVSATITVTPMNNGCAGAPLNYQVTVNPLDKDVFVPNVFTPNADGKNDILYVYSNYVTQLEMRIFNQYGQEIHMINNINRGWDGTHKGKHQPVGVYVYTLKAVLTDGRIIKSKGSITLLR